MLVLGGVPALAVIVALVFGGHGARAVIREQSGINPWLVPLGMLWLPLFVLWCACVNRYGSRQGLIAVICVPLRVGCAIVFAEAYAHFKAN